MADQPKEDHAREFTDIERQVLRVWFDVDQAGNDQLADAILSAGLQFEHYTSLLPSDAGTRTAGQLATQQRLAFALSEQLSQASDFLRGNAGSKKAQDRVSGLQTHLGYYISPYDTKSV